MNQSEIQLHILSLLLIPLLVKSWQDYFNEYSPYIDPMLWKTIFCFLVFLNFFFYSNAEGDSLSSIIFPQQDRKWITGFGLTFTTTSREITEEQRRRLPALNIQVLRKINNGFVLHANLESDIVQNHIAFGPSFIFNKSDKSFFSVGNDLAYWHGLIKIDNFKYRGYGFLDYPNIIYGYKIRKDILVELKGEFIFNLKDRIKAGEIKIDKKESTFSGFAFSFYIEQPFIKDKYILLGFKAMYTDFYWGTWFIDETFHRQIFHPQIIACIIL